MRPVITWAIIRYLLGIAQMFGAVFSVILLIQTGLNKFSLIAVVITCVLTTIRVVLFGGRSNKNKFGAHFLNIFFFIYVSQDFFWIPESFNIFNC